MIWNARPDPVRSKRALAGWPFRVSPYPWLRARSGLAPAGSKR